MIEEYCNKWGILPECLHIVECLEGNEHYTYAGGNVHSAKEGDYIVVSDDLLTFSVRKVDEVYTNKYVIESVLKSSSEVYPIVQNITGAVNSLYRSADKVAKNDKLSDLLEDYLGYSLHDVQKLIRERYYDNLG